LDVLGHIVGPNEEQVNVGVAAVSLQYPLTGLLWGDPACFKEVPRRLAEAAF
jgi:hypothetical protein